MRTDFPRPGAGILPQATEIRSGPGFTPPEGVLGEGNRFARALDAAGVGARAGIAALLPNVPESLFAYRGAGWSGRVWTPICWHWNVDEVRYVVVASETFNQKNQGASIAETMTGLESIAGRVNASSKVFSAVIGASFGCPFEGEVTTSAVVDIGIRLQALGVDEILLADTIGCAVPSQVRQRVEALQSALGDSVAVGCHFHNTRNTGIANAVAAVESGVRILDASVGGIGGCPFAPRATGNISTEDLVYILRNMGYETGIDLPQLINVATWVEGYFDDPLPGQVMKAGLFPDDVIARQVASSVQA